jgi:hypothetical protein
MKNKHSLKPCFLQATHSTHFSMKKNCGFGSDIFMLQIRQRRLVLYHQHPQGHEEWVYLKIKKKNLTYYQEQFHIIIWSFLKKPILGMKKSRDLFFVLG